MDPRPPDALVDEAIRCPCTAGGKPWCARCECLVQLALARDVWVWEQATGLNWWDVQAEKQAAEEQRMRRIRGWRGLGYTLLGWTLNVLAVVHYVGWTLPRTAWLSWSGQIPRDPRDPHTWQSHDKEGKG